MLYRLLQQQAAEFHDKPAVIGETRRLSFRALVEETSSLASYLQQFDLPVGASVLIGIAPSPEFYVAFYSVAALGLVILPVLPSGKLTKIMVDSAPLVAFGSETFVREAQAPGVGADEHERVVAVRG